jgi:hypothetical protein
MAQEMETMRIQSENELRDRILKVTAAFKQASIKTGRVDRDWQEMIDA